MTRIGQGGIQNVNQNPEIKYKKSLAMLRKFFFVMAFIPILIGIAIFVFIEKNYGPDPFAKKVPCISYSPAEFGKNITTSEEEIYKALVKIKRISNCVRIYSVTRGLEKVPRIAEGLEMEVIAGAWLSKIKKQTDELLNDEEIFNLIKIAKTQKNIKYIVVGNETLYFKTLNQRQIREYIGRVREGIYGTTIVPNMDDWEDNYVPITTSEPQSIWGDNPGLIEAVDILGLHSLPYWQKQPLEAAIPYILGDIYVVDELTEKPIILLETGWPTNGPRYGKAVSGLINQRKFFDKTEEVFNEKGIFYNISDAFDVPAKIASSEGLVGPHWGVFDAKGNQKKIFSLKDICTGFGTYIFLMIIIFWYILGFFRYPFFKNDPLYRRIKDISLEKTLTFSFASIIILASLFSYVVIIFTRLVGGNLMYLQILCGIVSLYVFFELSQKIMHYFISESASKYLTSEYPRLSASERLLKNTALVSIHIAAKDEEPSQVIRTITSALMQSHKHIEVIYIDNNSKDDSSFQEVKRYFDKDNFSPAHTAQIFDEGRTLKLFYEKNIEGFKGGALNYALSKTSPDAKYIAVLDSDYEVLPNWIETGLDYAKENVGFIQFPQAYKEEVLENGIARGARLEQDYVFKVVYPMRSLLGNIVMNGTMVIIDRKAMPQEGWPIWSICEDGALGASISSRGYSSAYVPITAGFGKSPDSFKALRKQRNRWVFGSMQVVKKWAFDRKFKWNNTLALYIADWIGWIMHGLYPVILLFTISFIFSAWVIYKNIFFDWTFFLGLAFVSISLLLFVLNFEKYIVVNNYGMAGARFSWYVKKFIKNVAVLILLELSVVNTICHSILRSLVKNKMNFNVTRSIVSDDSLKSKQKKSIPWQFALAVFVIIALIGAYLMYEKVPSVMFLLPFAQIFIVFLPQVVYVLYKLKY